MSFDAWRLTMWRFGFGFDFDFEDFFFFGIFSTCELFSSGGWWMVIFFFIDPCVAMSCFVISVLYPWALAFSLEIFLGVKKGVCHLSYLSEVILEIRIHSSFGILVSQPSLLHLCFVSTHCICISPLKVSTTPNTLSSKKKKIACRARCFSQKEFQGSGVRRKKDG